MKSPFRIFLWFSVAATTCFFCFVIYGVWKLRQPPYELPAGTDVRKFAGGRWDWSSRSHPCSDSAEVITFSPDGATMSLREEYIHSSPDTGAVSIYDIQESQPGRIRGLIRGETRRTDAGQPVVWDLVPIGPDEYRWHRTDWFAAGFTGPMQRCKQNGGR